MPKRTKDKIESGFFILGMNLLEKQLIQPKKVLPSDAVFEFGFDLEHKVEIKEERAFVICVVKIRVLNGEIVGIVKVAYEFGFTNFKSVVIINDKREFAFKNNIDVLLNSIAISTTRGVAYSELRGTFLNQAIIPIVDPNEFSVSNVPFQD